MTDLISGADNVLSATLEDATGGSPAAITGAYLVTAALGGRDGVRRGGPYTLTSVMPGANWAASPPVVAVPIPAADLAAILAALPLPQVLCEIRVQMIIGGPVAVYRTGLATVLQGLLP